MARAPARPGRLLRWTLACALLVPGGLVGADGPGAQPPAVPPAPGAGAEADALTGLGLAQARSGDLEAAVETLRRALALRSRAGCGASTAATLRALGRVHEEAGDHAAARGAYAAALAAAEAAGDRGARAAALDLLGGLHWRLGEYAASLAYQERALAILEQLDDPRRVAAARANLGTVYQRLGDVDRALSCYEAAVARLREAGEGALAAGVLTNLGALYAQLGEPERALGCLEQARRGFEEAGDDAGLAAALGNAGHLQLSLGNVAEALACHERALSLRQARADAEGAVEARTALGLAQAAAGDPEQALASLRRAASDAESLGAQDGLVVALWATASVRLQAGEPGLAVAAARRAIEELPAMVGGLSDEHGALVRQRLSPVFETGLRAALALGSAEDAAFFLESGRAGALLEALGGRERLHAVVVPGALREAEARARAQEARALARYRRSLDAEDVAAMRAAAAEREAARRAVRAAIDAIQRQAKAAAHLVYPRAAPLSELRAALRADEAFVSYGVLPDRVVALVVTPQGARIVPLGAAADVHAACAAASSASAPGPDPAPEAEALRALVVAPLGLSPQVRRVLVSPDGPLAYVPFALLLPGREPVCVPSGTTWRLLAAEGRRRGEGVLALGDPDYETDGPGANQIARMSSGVGFAPLPHTREEARAVGDVVLLGAEATEEGLRYALGRRPRWRAVHLACHGVVDPDTPLSSALALTPAGDDDGFLTAMDVLRLRIDADLVVLSACRTGRGRFVRGEGVMGFVRAFMFAGAPRVLVSLWNGDDAAALALMRALHAGLRAGEAPATALARAQAQVRDQPAWAHPYYWAGWTLWGDAD